MATITRRSNPSVIILRRVPYKYYVHLTKAWVNRHLRMAYHDGTLEIVSPHLQKHEGPSRRLSIVVGLVADRLNIAYHGTANYTYRRSGAGPYRGKGKEPDESFFFGDLDRIPRDRDPDLDAGDPPPDLWIEVDNSVSSAAKLPVYAALGVPEVWIYRSKRKTLQFLRRVGDGYDPIERSLALPALTPGLVLEALNLGDRLFDSEWLRLLRVWVDRTFPQPPDLL